MKRITWWPQAWLGLVFSWGALVGWTAVTGDGRARRRCCSMPASIFWVIGYDTIYALQDREDDALVGVKSSALALGRHARLGVAFCYAPRFAALGGRLSRGAAASGFALLGLLPMALHLLWQVATLKPDDGADALAKFRSNRFAGPADVSRLLRGRHRLTDGPLALFAPGL